MNCRRLRNADRIVFFKDIVYGLGAFVTTAYVCRHIRSDRGLRGRGLKILVNLIADTS